MSRLDQIIAARCPGGVPFRELGTLIALKFGSRITKLQDAGSVFPVYGGGGESFRTDEYNRQDDYVISRFAMSETCVRPVKGRFWLLDSGFTFEAADATVDKDFIAYVLLSRQREIYASSSQGAQKNLRTDEFKKMRIPLPPLEVQQEVVKILNRFAELGTQLETEMTARRLQYAYYRNSFFEFGDIEQVPRIPLGDLGVFIRGRRFTKDDLVESGFPSIHYGEIYTHYGVVATSTLSQVRSDLAGVLRFAEPGDVIIAAVGETVEDVAKAVAWVGNDRVAIHDDTYLFRSDLDPVYVSFFMQTADFHSQKNKHVSRAKVKRLSGDGLGKILIPVPPLEEQKRLVSMLNKFETLANDRAIGLPAEVATRRRQFDYYRSRLTTFEEALV